MDAPLLALTTPIPDAALAAPAFRQRLGQLQGGILKAHGRNHASVLVWRVDAATPAAAAQRALGRFAAVHVTSALQQYQQARRREAVRGAAPATIPDEPFASVFLSADGYRRLGFDVSGFRDTSFQAGMRVAGPDLLRDPKPAAWAAPYRRPVHGLIVLARDDRQALEHTTTAVLRELAAAGLQAFREDGEADRDADDNFRDPLGFAHGVSQPLFFEADVARQGSARHWNPAAAPSLVLTADPLADADPDALGSFLVYRKLRTDVAAFDAALAQPGKPGSAGARELAAARLAGRFRGGQPLTRRDGGAARTNVAPPTNDFDYAADPQGAVCPFSSHVRKANPRGSGPDGLRDEREHRIARRGMNYRSGTVARGETGMLFMCFQARIQRQFEFMQRRWLDGPDFPAAGAGADTLAQFVSLRGGEYLFAPSLRFLASM